MKLLMSKKHRYIISMTNKIYQLIINKAAVAWQRNYE